MKNSLSQLALPVLLAGFLPFTAHAATCLVPSVNYPTIQSAVNDSGCTTINVAFGLYVENIAIARSLTLNGAEVGEDAVSRSGPESIIDGTGSANITITADNVTVDGFTLLGPVNQGTAVIVMMGSNTGEKIQNNIVNNPGRAASFNTSNTTFFQNAVHNTATSGDGFQQNSSIASNISILNNSFDGATGNYNADVTILGIGSSNIVVAGNSSSTDSTLVALFTTRNALIMNNTVTGATGSAVYIGGGDSDVTITANHITGGAFSAVKVANVFSDGPSTGIIVTLNTLTNNAYGVNVGPLAINTGDTVQVHRNRISGNSLFGVNNGSSGVVNATCNYWGASDGPGPVGPGSGDKVSTGVVFSPWLHNAKLGGPCHKGDKDHNKDDE